MIGRTAATRGDGHRRRIGVLAAIAVSGTATALVPPSAHATFLPTTVVPAADAAVEGNINNGWPFNCGSPDLGSQRYQQVYAGSAVSSGLITGIAFRPDSDFGEPFGPTTLPAVTVTLSTTAAPVGGLSLTFADNIGPDVMTVHSGDLTLSSADTGGPPRDFDITIPLQEPFRFDSGAGNLLLDVTVPTCGTTTQFDAEFLSPETSRGSTFVAGGGSPVAADAAPLGLVTRFSFAPETHDTEAAVAGPGVAQYSDPVTLSGHLIDTTAAPSPAASPAGTPVAGATLDFTVGPTARAAQSVSAGPTDTNGDASVLLAQMLQTPGPEVPVEASFTGTTISGQAYHGDTATATMNVGKEDCVLTYRGDTVVAPLAVTTLTADLGEPDTTPGDRSGKPVVFTVSDSSLNVASYSAVTDGDGTARTTVPLPSQFYEVVASFAGDAYYHPCTSTETPVTVEAASADVSGGGWFGMGGKSRTSFGLSLVPHAGARFTGQFQLRSSDGQARFHGSTATAVVTVGADKVRWKGTGRWLGRPGYEFEVVVDHGASGARERDTIAVTVYRAADASQVVYTSGGAQNLRGGNLTVH